MNEKQFMIDLWDVLAGNDLYCTIEQFREKYKDLLVDMDTKPSGRRIIRFMDDHNEWHLTLLKVWSEGTKTNNH